MLHRTTMYLKCVEKWLRYGHFEPAATGKQKERERRQSLASLDALNTVIVKENVTVIRLFQWL